MNSTKNQTTPTNPVKRFLKTFLLIFACLLVPVGAVSTFVSSPVTIQAVPAPETETADDTNTNGQDLAEASEENNFLLFFFAGILILIAIVAAVVTVIVSSSSAVIVACEDDEE